MRFGYLCPRSFDDLGGDGPDRSCDACGRTVVDLSLLTEHEAAARVRAEPGLCGHVVRDSRGGWVRRTFVGPVAASAVVMAQPCSEVDRPVAEVEHPTVAVASPSYIELGRRAADTRTLEEAALHVMGYLDEDVADDDTR